jgi:putative component of membrane protein insertase Oxa1/YidC/SpoIIIJ protein YidD
MVFRLLSILIFPLYLSATPGYFEPWGKDADLLPKRETLSTPPPSTNPLSLWAEKIILFHQDHISPLHGSRSNFRPTSSRYMLLAIRRYGFLTGTLLGLDRLMRENKDPWVYRTRKMDGKIYKWDPTIY